MPKTSSRVFTITTKANAAIRILPENPGRVVWSAMNLSDTEIFFGYDKGVATSGRTRGWRIAPSYGSVEDEHSKDEIFIICTAGNKDLTVQEVTKVE